MLDCKMSYRKGKTVVEVHVDTSTAPCQHCNEMETHLDTCVMRVIRSEVVHTEITRLPTEYKSINAAKKANRLTKYRTVSVKAGAK
jgi:hypothetical protein